MNQINKGIRVANLIIDMMIVMIITFFVLIFVNAFGLIKYNEIFYGGIHFCYYFVLELVYNQTLGKMITKTIVVDVYNKKPTFINYFESFESALKIPLQVVKQKKTSNEK